MCKFTKSFVANGSDRKVESAGFKNSLTHYKVIKLAKEFIFDFSCPIGIFWSEPTYFV